MLPAQPTGITATGGDAQVSLSWDDPDDSSISGYRYSADSGATFADIPGSDATTVSYTVSGLTNYTSYDFAIRAVNTSGPGPVSDTTTATPAPPPTAPTNLSATPGDTQATLSWDDPNNSTITKYQYSTDAGATFTDIPGSDATTVSYTVGGLTSGAQYTLGIRAVNTTVEGAGSTVMVLVLPAQPAGLTATGGDAQVSLSWDNPDDSSISGYRYSTDGGATFTDISDSDATTTSYTVTGLTNYTSYDFAIRAVNASGPGPVSDTATATPAPPPAAPTNLSATPGDRQVALFWDDSADSSITAYQYSADAGATFIDVPDSDATTVSYTVTGLTSGAEYTLGIRAVNTTGPGAASTLTTRVLPAKPTGLTAAGADTQVTLRWDDPDDPHITDYEYQQVVTGADYGAVWTDIPSSDHQTTSYTVSGLTSYTSYEFRVRAVNDSGPGPVSDTAGATPGLLPAVAPANLTVPAAPVDLSAVAGDRKVTLSWNNPADSSINNYQYSTDGGATFTDMAGSDNQTTSFTVGGLTTSAEYTFELRAVNDTGEGAVSTVKVRVVPAQPTGLVATGGDTQVTLSWTDPDDSHITGYELWQAELAKLVASDAYGYDRFGWSVGVDGDTIVVGAPYDDNDADGSGSVYVFTKDSGGVWNQTKLTASDAGAGDFFGQSVGIDGDTIVVGAPHNDNNNADGLGSVYVFTKDSGGVWNQTKLTASDAGAGDFFGQSVGIDGDTIVVGAPPQRQQQRRWFGVGLCVHQGLGRGVEPDQAHRLRRRHRRRVRVVGGDRW